MKTAFLEEISKIQGQLQLWNIYSANGGFRIKKSISNDIIHIALTPCEHDYICNGILEEIVKIIEENSNHSWHTYHIGVTSILVEHKDGHMITAITPEINFSFFQHD